MVALGEKIKKYQKNATFFKMGLEMSKRMCYNEVKFRR